MNLKSLLSKKFIFLIFIFLVLRLPVLSLPLERDEGVYAYHGWMWLTGQGIPYRDSFELKGPLLQLVYGLPSWLFGNSFFSIRLFSVFYGVVTFGIFYLLLLQSVEKKWVFWLGGLYALVANDYWSQAPGFNAETVQLLPLVIVLLGIWKILHGATGWRWWVGIGLCSAAVLLIKHATIFPVGFLVGYLFWQKRDFKKWVVCAVGFVLPILIFGAYFWHTGSLPALKHHLFGAYGTAYLKDNFTNERFCYGFDNLPTCIGNWMFRVSTPTPMFLLGFCGLGWALSFRKRNYVWWISVLYTLGIMVTIRLAGWKDWPHYYLLLAPGLVLGTVATLNLWKGLKSKLIMILFVDIAIFTLASFLSIWREGPRKVTELQYGEYNQQLFWDAVLVSEWIKKNVSPSERVLVWNDEAEIYYYAEKLIPFHYPYYYTFSLPEFDFEKEKWLRAVENDLPEQVITTEYAEWKMVELWENSRIRNNYHKEAEVGVYTVWGRK